MRNPIMVGERVYLRPIETSDADDLARSVAAEPEMTMEWRFPTSPLAFEHHITELHKQQPPRDITFAVCLREDDHFIGDVGLYGLDYVNRTAETGSWMSLPQYRGRGYGTEAKMLLLEYAFDRLQLHVLYSYVWEPNQRSAAALRKQGYQPAGRYKYAEPRDGVYRDLLLFDVLREDWLAARQRWREERGA